jgi:hypothetical protein
MPEQDYYDSQGNRIPSTQGRAAGSTTDYQDVGGLAGLIKRTQAAKPAPSPSPSPDADAAAKKKKKDQGAQAAALEGS